MLPGFRFLFAAILLSISVLIFGLGAAALLRAAHEEFASNPTWRAPPETIFAQAGEPTRPVLATLVIDPPPAEQKKPDAPVAAAPEAPAAVAAPSAEAEPAAAPKPVEALPRAADKSETSVETPPASEPVPVQAKAAAETPAAAEIKFAAIEEIPPQPVEAARAPDDKTATKVATRGGSSDAVETARMAKPVDTEADKSAAKKRTERAKARRRLAAQQRARLAGQANAQPATDPFGQTATPATVVTRRKR